VADGNNFFVSCESSVDSSLEGRAVGVLSNNDGCVVARSNEAKRLGIRMGQPAFEIRDLIRSQSVIALSGNHLLYREISLHVHDVFRRYVPKTLDYSIDEAFLDMTGIPDFELSDIGRAIYEACRREVGIPVTIGFAPSKTLAKLVTERCKKCGEAVGVLLNDEQRWEIMSSLKISELWGVGRRLTRRLYESGVYTIADFARKDRVWVRKRLGVNGEKSWLELNGVSCIELGHVDRLLQDSISESRTFPVDVDDYDYVRARIAIYSADCAKKLRAMHGLCREVGVLLRTNRFHMDRQYQAPQGVVVLGGYSSDTNILTDAALRVLDTIWRENVSFKRAGVWLSDIVPDTPVTPSIFEEYEERVPGNTRLMQAVDKINGMVGHNVVKLASQITKGHVGHNDGYSSSFGAPFNPDR
ncbi:MAG: Y-family DNA polymerase, partial [Muribaculaceae bacterium]|nr:Y-family DNA polymerase [Muribaculaceae bacterium]